MPAAPRSAAPAVSRGIAHRGASAAAPENTLAALELAARHGAAWAEVDVRRTACGRLVLFHDDRLERTSDGQGCVEQRSWAELSVLDAGGWHSPGHRGERIPTLEQALELAAGQGLGLVLELKPVAGRGAELGGLVAAAAEAQWSRADAPLMYSSSDAEALRALREGAPARRRALVIERLDAGTRAGHARRALALGCGELHAHHGGLEAGTLAAMDALGLAVRAWTVNDAGLAARLFAAGLAGIFSDLPELFAEPGRPAPARPGRVA